MPTKQFCALHKERIATLQQAADLLNTEYKDDRRSYDELCQGRLLLVYAKLAAAETGDNLLSSTKASWS